MDHGAQIGYLPVKSRLIGDSSMSPRFGAAGQGPAYSLAFVRLQDRALIARGGSDGVIRFIDLPSGETLHEIEAHRGAVRALTPLADAGNGQRLASCGVDCVVRVWDLDTFARTSEVRLANPKQDHAQLTHATIAGRALIAITVGAEVHLWDPVTGELIRWFPAHQSTVWALASHNGGNSPLLASGAADSRIRVWDPATGSLRHGLARARRAGAPTRRSGCGIPGLAHCPRNPTRITPAGSGH